MLGLAAEGKNRCGARPGQAIERVTPGCSSRVPTSGQGRSNRTVCFFTVHLWCISRAYELLNPRASSDFHKLPPRWATLTKSALGAAVAMGTLTAGQAHAFVVTVDSVQYDVTTFAGSYNSNIDKFALPANGGGWHALVE